MGISREKTISIHSGVGYGIVSRELTEALSQVPRHEELLEKAFTELEGTLEGNYRDILRRKGRSWVMGIGAEFATHHLEHVTAVKDFGDTYEYSRELRKKTDAKAPEIEAASKELGIRIFEDLAQQFMLFHATGNLVGEEASARVWQAAFLMPARDTACHMIETQYKDVAEGEGVRLMPVINRIWAIIPDRKKSRIEDYRHMMAEARDRDMGFLADDVKMTLIVPADSDIAKIPAEELAAEGIEIMELPIVTSQFTDFGVTMLYDNTPTADAATKKDRLRYVTPSDNLPPDTRTEIRMLNDRRAMGGWLPRPSSFSTTTESLQERLLAAHPPSSQDELNRLEDTE